MKNIEKKFAGFLIRKVLNYSSLYIELHLIYRYYGSKKLCISNDTNMQEDNLSVLSGLRKCVGCKNYILSIIC